MPPADAMRQVHDGRARAEQNAMAGHAHRDRADRLNTAPAEDAPVHCEERSDVDIVSMPDARTLIAAGDLLRALAAPVRISIVLQLRQAERCVHELVEALGVTQPLISQHLRVLKSAGVVHGTRQGREVVYRLVDGHLAHIVVDAVTHVDEPRTSIEAEDA